MVMKNWEAFVFGPALAILNNLKRKKSEFYKMKKKKGGKFYKMKGLLPRSFVLNFKILVIEPCSVNRFSSNKKMFLTGMFEKNENGLRYFA